MVSCEDKCVKSGSGRTRNIGNRKGVENKRTGIFRRERHRMQRIGWLRAAVLAENDGIVSTACLVLGVAPCTRLTAVPWSRGPVGPVATVKRYSTLPTLFMHELRLRRYAYQEAVVGPKSAHTKREWPVLAPCVDYHMKAAILRLFIQRLAHGSSQFPFCQRLHDKGAVAGCLCLVRRDHVAISRAENRLFKRRSHRLQSIREVSQKAVQLSAQSSDTRLDSRRFCQAKWQEC